MKCEVAKDLITLYTEQLCSPECAKELESHLEDCPECRKQLEHYRQEINGEKVIQKSDNISANAAGLKPMKKIKKKLVFRKKISIVLSVILALIVLCIGMLSYGEMTNRYLSFSVIADMFKIKNVCESLADGNIQALVDIIAVRLEDRYAVRGIEGVENFEEYENIIKVGMDAAYEYYFMGKDIDVKIENVMIITPDELIGADQPLSDIEIGFYDKNEQKDEPFYTMIFSKVSVGKFVLTETMDNPEIYFTSHMLPYDELILDISIKHFVRRQYDKLRNGEEVHNIGAGLSLMIETMGTEEEIDTYRLELKEKVVQLYDSGWYIKDVMYDINEFDLEAGKWVYNLWFMMEDQSNGNLCMMEQKFHFSNYNLYAIDGMAPMIMAADGVIPKEIEQKMLSLFQ